MRYGLDILEILEVFKVWQIKVELIKDGAQKRHDKHRIVTKILDELVRWRDRRPRLRSHCARQRSNPYTDTRIIHVSQPPSSSPPRRQVISRHVYIERR